MKILPKVIGILMMIAMLFTCAQDELSDIAATEDLSQELKWAVQEIESPEFYCNRQPVLLDLITMEADVVGTVTLVNDEAYIYASFEMEEGVSLDRFAAYIGDKQGIPLNKRGVPTLLRFPYRTWSLGASSFTFAVPLEEINDPCPAVLISAKLSNGDFAWAQGEEGVGISFADLYKTRRWGFQNEYCVIDCAEANYFTLKFFVERPDGSKFWSIMEGAEQFYFQDDWCDQMGVVRLTENISLPVKRGVKDIGTVDLILEEGKVHGIINLDDAGSMVYRTHVFYGSLRELDEYGACPEYYSFPYLFEESAASDFEIYVD